MEGVATQVTSNLLGLGLPGVIIIGLGLAVRALWIEIQVRNKLLLELAIKSTASIEQNTASLTRLSDILIRGKEA